MDIGRMSASHSPDSHQRQPSTKGPRDWYQDYGIRHVAIIPDGNRRWAAERSLPIELGHAKGLLEVMPDLVERLSEAGVHTITVWGFSTENWSRQSSEVSHLMKICAEFLRNRLHAIAMRHGARLVHLGRKDRINSDVRNAIESVAEATANNREHIYNLAFDYGGRDELIRASERMLAAARNGESGEKLSIYDCLDTQGQPHPEPDLVVRSSGEHRMSGFMPWQAAYSEIFFVERYFPDFNFALLEDLAEQFLTRKRRFGG
jgi:undecaprenyl diphosphate synthase